MQMSIYEYRVQDALNYFWFQLAVAMPLFDSTSEQGSVVFRVVSPREALEEETQKVWEVLSSCAFLELST